MVDLKKKNKKKKKLIIKYKTESALSQCVFYIQTNSSKKFIKIEPINIFSSRIPFNAGV
jgi:hypothetical protein